MATDETARNAENPMGYSRSWSNYPRPSSKSSSQPFKCPQREAELPGTVDFAAATIFRKHISAVHPGLEDTAPQLFNTVKDKAEGYTLFFFLHFRRQA